MRQAKQKTWAFRSVEFALALCLLSGWYQLWWRVGVRTRPWQLEACLDSRLAECRAGPGVVNFRDQCEKLSAHADKARGSLAEADGTWAVWRDYSTCTTRLLSVCAEADLLNLRLAIRHQEQNQKLEVLLASLVHELEPGDENGTLPPKLRIRGIEQARARSLAEQAMYLKSRGEVEAALTAALRAWASWRSYSHLVDRDIARFEDPALREKWNRQAIDLLLWTKEKGRRAILIDKFEHRCLLLNAGQIEKSFAASLSRNWYAQKLQERDAATPEGKYKVTRMIASGKYGMALLLDYPNAADRERFAALKRQGAVDRRAGMGGNVEIHGAGRPDSDWTDGCVSLNNYEMQELYRHAYSGMPVTIVGTCKLTSTQRGSTSVSR